MIPPSWTSLRKIKTTKIAPFYSSLTVIVPVYASGVLTLDKLYQVSQYVPVNLLALYFSSLAFLAAGIIFDLSCPRVISEYENKYRFVESCVCFEDLVAAHVKKVGHSTESIINEIAERFSGAISDKVSLEHQLSSLVDAQLKESSASQLEDHWDNKNYNHLLLVRWIIIALYAASFILALYVTLYSAPSTVVKAFVF